MFQKYFNIGEKSGKKIKGKVFSKENKAAIRKVVDVM